MSLDSPPEIESLHASQKYVWLKSRWIIYSFPVVLYGFLAAVHSLLGFDLTGGWMGTPNDHPMHLTLLLASPILFLLQLRAVRDLWFRRPVYIRLSAEKLSLVLPDRREYRWDAVVDVSVTQSPRQLNLRVKRPSGDSIRDISIPESHLHEPIERLVAQFEARGMVPR